MDKEFFYFSSPVKSFKSASPLIKTPDDISTIVEDACYFKPLSLSENDKPYYNWYFKVDEIERVYNYFESNDDELFFCKLYCRLSIKGKIPIYVYIICKYFKELANKEYDCWYTKNPNIFINELKKDVFVNNYQSILDLFKHDCNDIKNLRLKVAKCRKWLN